MKLGRWLAVDGVESNCESAIETPDMEKRLCRRMWALLQLHAKQCKEAACPVPRCRELRELRRRQVARKALVAMLHQQAKAGQ